MAKDKIESPSVGFMKPFKGETPMRKPLLLEFGLACLLVATPTLAAADEAAGPDPKEIKAVLDKGAAFLKKRQAPDGSFLVRGTGPGVTALVAAAYLSNSYSVEDPVVAKAMASLE